eukprot:GHRR01012056.1.p1 GENE.GHRR01012056.1~~GHRR01012056.1.p1  ORF type:complete len:1048 (+),score=392.88 GHRR01012056.1:336-3479(+)
MSFIPIEQQQWQAPQDRWQGPPNRSKIEIEQHLLGVATPDGFLFNQVPVAGQPHPLVGSLVQQDQPMAPGDYSSSSSILYAMDGSRSSLPSSSHGATGSFRRMYATGTMGSMGDTNLSRSDYAYIGPPGMAGGAGHSVEGLLETIAALPPHQDAAQVVGGMLQHLDSSALAALMKELGRAGLFKRSVELFDFLRRKPSPEYTHLLDIYTYTTAIAVCSASQQLQRALDLMAEMRTRGITCNVHTYSALMNVCIKCNEVGLVQQVYSQMIQEGCTPNLVTYNTLIDLYVKTGQWQEAIKLLDKLEEEGIQPEVRTYNTIITACNKSGKPEQGLKIYERMVVAGVKPSATTYTALISAYGKQGLVEKAMDIFADMVQKGCERNVITYSSLISACEKAGRYEMALQLFERMHKEGCVPNVVTYNSLIAACSHGGHWEKAKECFNQMLAQGCRPDGITFSALITAYQRGNQWRKALHAFSQMPSSGCHPDSVVYNALLEVCWGSGVLQVQSRAMQIWSLANRSGHFRIYNQNKGDPAVHQHSCVVFTHGAAIVTLLRWLCDVRHKVGHDATSLLRERVVFCLQKGKASRIEQPSSTICEAVGLLLAGHGSPFTVRLVESTTQLEAVSSELVAWLRSPAFSTLSYLVHANSAKRLSVEQLVSEDLALEKSCTDALSYVRTYEQLRGYHKQVQPNLHDPLGPTTRQQLLDLALQYGNFFRFQPETCYDAWELLQRLLIAGASPPLGASGGQMWKLMLVACMLMAARQPAAEPPHNIPSYDMVCLNTGYLADSILATEQNIMLVLGNDVSAVSALRVCQVLLERLGGQQQEARQAGLLTEDLQNMMYRVCCSSTLFRVQPSLVAMAVVYCLRRLRGIVPLWPAALLQLTGIYDPTLGDLGLVLEQVAPLLGVNLQASQAAVPPPPQQVKLPPPPQQQNKQQQPPQPAAPLKRPNGAAAGQPAAAGSTQQQLPQGPVQAGSNIAPSPAGAAALNAGNVSMNDQAAVAAAAAAADAMPATAHVLSAPTSPQGLQGPSGPPSGPATHLPPPPPAAGA